MRRLIASLTATLLLLSVLAPSVVASNGAATPFKLDLPGMACSGAHVVNKVSVKDSETCLFADGTGMTAGTYQSGPDGIGMTPFGKVAQWHSDYNGTPGALAKSWTMTAVDNGNGSFTVYVVAYYSNRAPHR